MELRVIALLLFLFSIHPVESYALKKRIAFLFGCKWAPRRKESQLRLKINDFINFKDKEELKREIVTQARKISLDLSDEQINSIGNNLCEFFSYLKLKDIRIGVPQGRSKRSGKPLPLCWEENKYEEFHTQNMRKEGDYYVEDSNSYSN
ncbi:conserved Plasmodium protein, unknown function [Plasmodium knowlesi strain H]|uniref:Uncharacterized protein n=3 Tax=Plasmodium knowlesi TaxID=5850 RepID=A0A5K1V207_PLAKH|nr:conserved Plasmodium protein, unknown function [Plasmodium knowlesi strain H]OTN68419.1 Uncharacterized protein PKNOH_S02293400 [Plasmodium knowlesi]CAA9986439.1 conserved Plasmodium protein, unknown function [Plasmodium knowlesi strain H]SBO24314.1 conserved Plasmodium protein, unknown function [Plasmodium knowlesi strain H]SBO29687.1 conserved Plasmodium protein, unknown function [Plasmodium knowlesi strain H]VVS75913.1 conserved Plasmodium protein, unknown function [Plasmodium knowlesi s|eukprot:XP_002260988.1 hypothetical protein, conserved in Plasmodium species [Plasmodium knowlesi strain H]